MSDVKVVLVHVSHIVTPAAAEAVLCSREVASRECRLAWRSTLLIVSKEPSSSAIFNAQVLCEVAGWC